MLKRGSENAVAASAEVLRKERRLRGKRGEFIGEEVLTVGRGLAPDHRGVKPLPPRK
jgi:hypothetical protein